MNIRVQVRVMIEVLNRYLWRIERLGDDPKAVVIRHHYVFALMWSATDARFYPSRQGKNGHGRRETRRIKEGRFRSSVMSRASGLLSSLCTRRYRNRNQRFQQLRGSGRVK
jgi:hypothetical protein